MNKNRKSKFLFDLPFTSDWLFWLFIFILLANLYNGFLNVQNSGGLNVSNSFSLISGLIDGDIPVVKNLLNLFNRF
jgi:uncharacterized membrane protein (DUF485 family)